MNSKKLSLSLLVVCTWLSGATAQAQGTAFTYQGRLTDGANPANGTYDLRFTVYDAVANGNVVSGTITKAPTAVSSGVFTVTLDFGVNVFNGSARWLDIGVRTNGSTGPYSVMAPRQMLTPSPYAITAGNVVAGGIPAGTYGNAVTFNSPANNFSGVFMGDGSGLANVSAANLGGLTAGNFWQTTGNAGTTAGPNFLGTTDNQPLEVHVNGQRAFRLEPTTGGPNVIGGYNGNSVAAGSIGVTIGGGGDSGVPNVISSTGTTPQYLTIGGGAGNSIANTDHATISGGGANSISQGNSATIGGGSGNTIVLGHYSTLSGGSNNRLGFGVSANDTGGTISGGQGNQIYGAVDSTIGGGIGNLMDGPPIAYATIAGGLSNVIAVSHSQTIGGGANNTNNSTGSTIAGGENNYIYGDDFGGSATDSAIGGGLDNYVDGRCIASTIAGGRNNQILFPTGFTGLDESTIGGGISNLANGICGTIPGGINNTAANFAFAAGSRAQAVNQGAFVWADSQSGTFSSTASDQVSFRCQGGVTFTSGSGAANQTVSWTPGSGSWSFSSDRNLKDRFQSVDARAVLEKVSQLPIMEWSYKEYPERHIGAMAQDFHALFPLNANDKALNDADLHGVALAAIKGLNQKLEERDAEVAELKANNSAMEKRLADLEKSMNRLVEKNSAGEK